MFVMKLRTDPTILLLLLSIIVQLVQGSQPDVKEFRIPSNGTFTELIKTSQQYVYHMEADKHVKGNILFSIQSALYTTNGRTKTTLIVGSEGTKHYNEGIGSSAAFNYILGFTQLQSEKVIVTDYSNHCIRLVDRKSSSTSHLAGRCDKYSGDGFQDGINARFEYPKTIIKDQMKDNYVIIADEGNNALRSLEVNTGNVSTLVQLTRLSEPAGLLQDIFTGDIYISTAHAISKFHYAKQYVSTITGSSTAGFRDGGFGESKFDEPRGIVMLSKDLLLVADSDNHRLRLLNLVTRQTTSICTGQDTHTYGSIKTCAIKTPRSLLIIGDTLYIGGYGAIGKIQGNSADIPHWIGQVTQETGGFCVDKTMTKILKPGETKVKVEIVPGIAVHLGLGEHKFEIDKFSFDCTQIINVIEDSGVIRRLSFEADYDVKCSTVSAEGTLKTIMSVAESSFNQLQPICQADCGKLETKKPEIHCTGDVLTITWFTNVTYTADEMRVPRDMQQRLMKRLSSNPILSIFILTKQPPVVFPRKTSDGKYVEITLTNDCRDGKTYSAKDDTCN